MIQQKVRKKKRPILMLIFSHSVKNHGTKITYTSQFVLMSCPRHFPLMFCGTASLALFFFAKIKAFVLIKLLL